MFALSSNYINFKQLKIDTYQALTFVSRIHNLLVIDYIQNPEIDSMSPMVLWTTLANLNFKNKFLELKD